MVTRNCKVTFSRKTHLDQEEMDSEGGKTARQFDVLDLGVDFGGSHQVLVFVEDLLLDVARSHVRLREELLQAANDDKLMREGLMRMRRSGGRSHAKRDFHGCQQRGKEDSSWQ